LIRQIIDDSIIHYTDNGTPVSTIFKYDVPRLKY